MNAAECAFWLCLALTVYAYLLYPLILFFAYAASQVRRDWRYLVNRQDRRVHPVAPHDLPAVGVLIPAYNEEARLPARIANLRELDYPRDKLEVIFVSDGSTDRTNHILAALDELHIRAFFLPSRSGKSTALNHAVAEARADILVFSDSSTLFTPDALKKFVRHFADPRVGAVCGALEFERTSESRQTEGVYWKYESMLRLMEARLGATLTASGAVYALRRQCYRPLPAHAIVDDFLIPMLVRAQGYRVVYDPEATAIEFAAESVAGEFARRVRLAMGSFRALPSLLRTPMGGFTRVAFFSHKLLRWIVPFLLIGIFVSNAFLLAEPLYRLAFFGQLCFYLWAGLGAALRQRLHRIRYALVGYFLLAMNLALLVGFFRYLTGREEATWQRVR